MKRRAFIHSAAHTCLGVSLARAAGQNAIVSGKGSEKSVIYLLMSGGMTHIDTLDPKPDADASITGGRGAIESSVPGIRLGSYLPKVAQQMDKISLIRNMTSTQGAHEQGRYFMRTGYSQGGATVHPSVGGWSTKLLGKDAKSELPNFVTVGAANEHPGSGFLGASHSPLPIGDPDQGLADSKLLRGVSRDTFLRQLALRQKLDSSFSKTHGTQSAVQAYDTLVADAVKLMESKDLAAFDIRKEPPSTHELYGKHPFAKGVLLARRLVQHGVRFVDVEFGGFDWHDDVISQAETTLPVLDQALAGLLYDLEGNGMLENTLVVVATEFGRSPVINENGGRDHYPQAFSTLMAGGGIKGGFVLGGTDETGSKVSGETVNAADVNATIGQVMGLPVETTITSEDKRPFKMSGKEGKAISELFA